MHISLETPEPPDVIAMLKRLDACRAVGCGAVAERGGYGTRCMRPGVACANFMEKSV
jgi:hypothetical protein